MITPSVFGAEQHVCKRSTLAVLTSRHGGKHMWQLYFATDLHRVRPWVNDINYDNGNEINKVHLLNLLQVSFKYMFWTKYMFWSMFSLLVIEGIFFRTSIWNTKNIFGKFSSSPSLTALELKGVSLHVLQYRRVTWVTCPKGVSSKQYEWFINICLRWWWTNERR